MECATRQICLVAASTKCIDSERVQPQLEVSSGIRFPAILTHSSVPIQDQAGQSRSDPHLPTVAVAGLVSHPPADGNRYPTHFPAEPLSHPLAQTGAASPPPVRQIYADCMAVIRGRFQNQGIPSNVIDLLMASNRQTTTAAYQSAWTNWLDWCDKRNTDPISPSINLILQYFSHLFQTGMATSTINVHRSTLSMTFEPIEGKNVGEHPLVLRLLKGCYNLKPPVPRYNKLWDPDIVLNHFATLGPNSDLALSILSKKLAMLLSLSIISRVSEICSTYIAATTKWRKPEDDSLFLAVRRPHRPVSSSTVGHWIKSCLNDAGIDIASFSAHSTRRVASCKAVSRYRSLW